MANEEEPPGGGKSQEDESSILQELKRAEREDKQASEKSTFEEQMAVITETVSQPAFTDKKPHHTRDRGSQ